MTATALTHARQHRQGRDHARSVRTPYRRDDRSVEAAPAPRDLVARVRLAVELAVTVMLEQPEVNRAVMSWIGTAGPSPGQVLAHSAALWALATQAEQVPGSGDRNRNVAELSVQLALGFRGVLSFWTAGEIADDELAPAAQTIAATLVAGFSDPQHGAGRREQ